MTMRRTIGRSVIGAAMAIGALAGPAFAQTILTMETWRSEDAWPINPAVLSCPLPSGARRRLLPHSPANLLPETEKSA